MLTLGSKAGPDELGESVALSANGKIALLGAPMRARNGAQVFTRTNGKWALTAGLSTRLVNAGLSVALNPAGTTVPGLQPP